MLKKTKTFILCQLNEDLYYTLMYYKMKRKFLKKLRAGKVETKTSRDSYNMYQDYNEREQIDYNSDSRSLGVINGKVKMMTQREKRSFLLEHIVSEISSLLKQQQKVKVLEVGCGNCINLVELKKKFGDKAELTGIDFSEQRLKMAGQYFKDQLAGIATQVGNATHIEFADNSFDLVYSMHCLEQISYKTTQAVYEMHRVSANKIIWLEPVFEFAKPAQKLYLYLADHVRILLKTVKELKYNIEKAESCNVQDKLNQSSVIIVRK